MAYTGFNVKRRNSIYKSSDCFNSTPSDQDLPCEIELAQRKRQRFSTAKPENESSTDSFTCSNTILSESEGSSDSEFEEHPYSKSDFSLRNKLGLSVNARRKPKSDISLPLSQCSSVAKKCKKSKCTSKNAVMARLNRLKKKKYIEDLENKNSQLESENRMLKNMLDIKSKEVESLNRKTLNLENVIRNKTEIGSLLRCVRENTNLEISSSIFRKESNLCTEVNNQYSDNSGSSEFNEVKLSPFIDEGNDRPIFNFNSEPFSSPIEFLDTITDEDVGSDHPTPLLYQLDSMINSSAIELPNSPNSAGYEGVFSPSRCETPSKGFDVSANKNLFGDVGVCFHIANNKVSLEFCDSCNVMASV